MKLNGLIINREVTVKNEEKFGIAKYIELEDGTKCIKIHETQDENSPVIKEFRNGKSHYNLDTRVTRVQMSGKLNLKLEHNNYFHTLSMNFH